MKHFDVVILGAGSAGESMASTLAKAGKDVALIERFRVGGQCAYSSCMPSKSMLRSAQVRNGAKNLVAVGASLKEVDLGNDQLAFTGAAKRRNQIAEFLDDSGAASSVKAAGVTLLRGTGIIAGANTVRVNDQIISWSDLVIATGSTATIPKIPGLDSVKYWTSEDALVAMHIPESILIIGGGPVACEISQIFSRFGSKTTIVEFGDQLAGKEHPLISKRLEENLIRDGVRVLLLTQVERVEEASDGKVSIHLSGGEKVVVDKVIVATGRHPETSNMGFEELSLDLTDSGAIAVDERCRATGKSNIWAAGDVVDIAPFTHTASYQGEIITENLLGVDRIADYRVIPRAIYTDPPVSSVGTFSPEDATVRVVTAEFDLMKLSRTATDGAVGGLLILAADVERKILIGAAAIGPHADDLVAEASLAIKAKVPLSLLNDLVHAFPTYGAAFHDPIKELVKLTS